MSSACGGLIAKIDCIALAGFTRTRYVHTNSLGGKGGPGIFSGVKERSKKIEGKKWRISFGFIFCPRFFAMIGRFGRRKLLEVLCNVA
jgi:hypothetical protein